MPHKGRINHGDSWRGAFILPWHCHNDARFRTQASHFLAGSLVKLQTIFEPFFPQLWNEDKTFKKYEQSG